MPFTVFSWNLQRLNHDSQRYQHVEAVINAHQPDIMFVSEVAADFAVAGYKEVGHALSLNDSKTMGQKHVTNLLSTKLFQRVGSNVEVLGARATREAPDQPRQMIKGNLRFGGANYVFDFVHSKATEKAAGEALASLKDKMSASSSSVIGDINFSIHKPANMVAASSGGHQVVEMVDMAGNIVSSTHAGGSKLDYIVATADLNIQPVVPLHDTMAYPVPRVGGLPARGAAARVMRLSDHIPIIFSIT